MGVTENHARHLLALLIDYLAEERDEITHRNMAQDGRLLNAVEQLILKIKDELTARTSSNPLVAVSVPPQPLSQQDENPVLSPAVEMNKEDTALSRDDSAEAVSSDETTIKLPLLSTPPPAALRLPLRLPLLESSPRMNNTEHTPPPLRPGAIPDKNTPRHSVILPLPTPAVKITIANARAGEPFSSRVNIIDENGSAVSVTDVIFNHDIGLTFDKENQLVSGCPTVSGDSEITVCWCSSDDTHHASPVLFIVNPDPKSLWKIIEPPADAAYFKAHVAHETLSAGPFRIAAASRRGRSHEHVGSFRDDDYFIRHSPSSQWSVMLVADGAGSARNSREGSRIATHTAGEYLFERLGGGNRNSLKNTDNQLAK